jgi:ribonuclease HI
MADKYYVVKQGRTPGIYNTWADCLKQVDKFSGAIYKSYKTLSEAEVAFNGNKMRAPQKGSSTKSKSSSQAIPQEGLRIFCDGACAGNPGKSGSGLAIYEDYKKPVLFYGAGDKRGTNNTAELKALLKALEFASESNHENIYILSDSKYSIDCVTNWAYGWKKDGWVRRGGEIKNLRLIQTTHALYDNIKKNVVISHVKGHAGIEGNELADRMAVIASNVGNDEFVEYRFENIDDVLALKIG